MSALDLEAIVAEFLDQRETDPSIRPEEYSERYANRAEVLSALEQALEVLRILSEDEPDRWEQPATIDGYRVLEVIGRGGMGVVYAVQRDGRRYALKLLTRALVAPDLTVDRFRREVFALSRVRHPSVVRIHASGVFNGVPYLVMDLVEGQPLSQLALTLEPTEAAEKIRDLALAVDAVHREGVLHRDLKPSNVIARSDGRWVLIDFGLMATDALPSLTMDGEVLGTPRYMAPEQARGAAVDGSADVYALGLLLAELVTGRPARASGSRDVVLAAARRGVLPPLRSRRWPPGLRRIVEHALATEPARRPETAEALASDLQRFLDGEPVHAPRQLPGRHLVRSRRAWFVAGILVLLTAVLSLVLPIRRDVRAEEARLDAVLADWIEGSVQAATRKLAVGVPVSRADAVALARRLEVSVDDAVAESIERDARILGEALQCAGPELADRLDDLVALGERGHRSTLHSWMLGRAAAASDDWALAERELTQVAARLNETADVARELGSVLNQRGDFERARPWLEAARRLRPRDAAIQSAWATCCAGLGDLDAAIAAAREGSGLSNAPASWLQLAELLGRQGGETAWNEADEILLGLLERDEDDLEARFQRAVLADRRHELPAAIERYRDVIARWPDHPRAALYLANLYSGAHRGKCTHCDRAFSEHPECASSELTERFLVEAIRIDAGRDPSFPPVALEIALRLPDRRGVLEALGEQRSLAMGRAERARLDGLRRRIEERGERR
ncbi:MAG: protein kinase [Planctomycetota bacterium]